MGFLDRARWTSESCSRISVAVTAVAAYVHSALAPTDTFSVMAFDAEYRVAVPWREKGPDLCPYCLMDDIKRATDDMQRSGTALFAAAYASCVELNAALPTGASGNLILVTDGEAMDPERFDSARSAILDPGFPMRMLLLHIDPSGFHSGFSYGPRDLGALDGGLVAEHFAYVEVPLPGVMNGSTGEGRANLESVGRALSSVHGLPMSVVG